jgi:anti-sigma factor (TIGR02949 family)
MTNPQHHHHSLERCRTLIAQLNDYLDGDLPPDLCAELEAHLAGCPDCRVVLGTLNQTVQILHTLDAAPPPLPAALEARLLARLALPSAPASGEP